MDHEADINASDNGGETPLMCAARNGHIEIMQLLLSNEKLENVKSQAGKALMRAVKYTPRGNTCPVEELIDFDETLINSTEYEFGLKLTPLMAASRSGDIGLVRLLLSRNADINAKDPDTEDTAITLAIKWL